MDIASVTVALNLAHLDNKLRLSAGGDRCKLIIIEYSIKFPIILPNTWSVGK